MSRISLVQLAGSVRKFNLNRPFICSILEKVSFVPDSDLARGNKTKGGKLYVIIADDCLMTSTTAPQRGVFASFALLLISMMLSGQALAFDVGGFSYTVIGATNDVQVEGCAAGPCSSSDVVIPATAVDGTTTYSVTIIGDYAFYDNDLASVTIPDSVTTVGYAAFESNALTSVIIPDSVTSIGGVAFARNALTSVIIPDSVTSIGGVAFARNALTSVTIPDSVKTIGYAAFYDNDLTSVIIPDSVTSIGGVAFAANALISLTIPDSVTSIGDKAFGRNALTSPAFLGNFGTFGLNMFENNANLATITYVQGATGWDAPLRIFTPLTGPTGSFAATPVAPTATPVPAGPLWLLGIMAGLLSLVGFRKLRKA